MNLFTILNPLSIFHLSNQLQSNAWGLVSRSLRILWGFCHWFKRLYPHQEFLKFVWTLKFYPLPLGEESIHPSAKLFTCVAPLPLGEGAVLSQDLQELQCDRRALVSSCKKCCGGLLEDLRLNIVWRFFCYISIFYRWAWGNKVFHRYNRWFSCAL